MTKLHNLSHPRKAPETKDSSHMYNIDNTYKFFLSPSYAFPLHQPGYKVLMDIYKANADLNFIGHTCNTVMVQVNSPAGQVLHFYNTNMVNSQAKNQLPAPQYMEL